MLTRAEQMWFRARALGNRGWVRWLVTGLMTVLSIAILGWILWRYWPTLIAYHWQLQVWPLVFGFVIYTFDMLLAVLGWSLILQQLGGVVNFREHFRIYCLTLAAGLIPGAPWHIAGRAVLYKQHGIARRVTGVAAGLEILLIIVSGLWSGLLILPFMPGNTQTQFIWLLIASIPCLGIIHPKVIHAVLKRIGQAEASIPLHYRHMLLLQALYFLIWGVGGTMLYAIVFAFYPLPLTVLPAIIGIWGLSGAVSSLASFSPASLGIKEVALSLLLASFVPPGLAVIAAIMARVFLTAFVFVWAIVASRL